jgi:hypothetical protein
LRSESVKLHRGAAHVEHRRHAPLRCLFQFRWGEHMHVRVDQARQERGATSVDGDVAADEDTRRDNGAVLYHDSLRWRQSASIEDTNVCDGGRWSAHNSSSCSCFLIRLDSLLAERCRPFQARA